jgi:hypothetical protein
VTLGIIAAEPATPEQWDEHWRGCRHASYFESRPWAEAWASYQPGRMRPAPVLLRFNDGRRVLLPITRERLRRGLDGRYLLSPAGAYGGWLTTEPLDMAHARMVVDWLLAERRPLWWRPNPFDPLIDVVSSSLTKEDVTHAVPLDRWLEAQRAHKGHMEAVRKARRSGVTIRHADRREDWEAYFAIYEHTLERWTEAPAIRYHAGLFEALRRHEGRGVELWLAEFEGERLVAGALNVYAHDHVSGWHMATRSDFFHLKPTDLLVHDMIADAHMRGFKWFDMNPSGGHEGVVRFKRHCGGMAIASPIVETDTIYSRALRSTARLAARS